MNSKVKVNEFFEHVYKIVEQIPYGKVISYGQIAWILDRPRAAREVGRAMRFCPSHLPYHRVVMSDGSIVGGKQTESRKIKLEIEGVIFINDRRVNMKLSGWKK